MGRTILKGGRVLDPSRSFDEVADVTIENGVIVAVGGDIGDGEVIDVSGCLVVPGFVDLNCHLSEPGGEHRETIKSGATAAVAGGFTSVCAMPDTDPPVDDSAAVGFVVAEGARAGAARVYPVAALSVGRRGEQLSEFGEVVDAGAVAVGDSASPVTSANLMRLALEYAQTFDLPVISFAEDRELCEGGVMNEGMVATRLGLRGKPLAGELIAVARDLALAEITGGRLHLQRLSSSQALELVRRAKESGVNVTVDVTPHHLLLTEDSVEGYGTDFKVNPPLRPATEVSGLVAGLRSGVIDAIATDHTACHYDEKEQAFDDAPFGTLGLETAFSVLYTDLVESGGVELNSLVAALTVGPAKAFGLPAGTLSEGAPADIAVLDLEKEWAVDPAGCQSKSRNSAFAGRRVKGKVTRTFVGGVQVWESLD